MLQTYNISQKYGVLGIKYRWNSKWFTSFIIRGIQPLFSNLNSCRTRWAENNWKHFMTQFYYYLAIVVGIYIILNIILVYKSPQSIQINSSSSFEIFGIIHRKIMEERQHFWENLAHTNKLRNTKLFVKKLNYPPDKLKSINLKV